MRKKIRKRELLEIIHTLPGRVRFQFEPEKAGIPNLDDFLKIPGAEEAIFNNITKTLLMVYDRKKLNLEKLILEIQKRMPGIEISKTMPQKNTISSEVPPTNDLLSDMICKTASRVNKNINIRTKGRASLNSIVPSGLLLAGLEELIRKPCMPHWYDMWWYAYNIFKQNHSRQQQNNSSITTSKKSKYRQKKRGSI